ncbi:MAG: hypothetical protein L0G70_07050 [Rubrobacter sp.]|nr:hypothetical protein [Rubrobacter sp.]
MLTSEGGAGGDKVGGLALEDDPATVVTKAGAVVDDPIGVRHDRLVGSTRGRFLTMRFLLQQLLGRRRASSRSY